MTSSQQKVKKFSPAMVGSDPVAKLECREHLSKRRINYCRDPISKKTKFPGPEFRPGIGARINGGGGGNEDSPKPAKIKQEFRAVMA